MALVAIVDDSKLARAFAATSLKQAGHQVAEIEPTSLDQVMGELKELRPDLLVLDQLMPTFLGSSLVRACFEDAALAALKVVILTTQHDVDIEHRMENLGVHATLHKPITPSDLNKVVAELVQGQASPP
jgi:two-component system chemotaxis response regulator CheY